MEEIWKVVIDKSPSSLHSVKHYVGSYESVLQRLVEDYEITQSRPIEVTIKYQGKGSLLA